MFVTFAGPSTYSIEAESAEIMSLKISGYLSM